MSYGPTKILLVEDNPGDARLIREMLAEAEGASFEIDWTPQLAAGLEKLSRGEIDLVLLDLGLPDSRGLDTFIRAYDHAPQIPFVVLTGLDDQTLALAAVRKGAQDYLVKGQTDGGLLLRAIRYATERKRIEEELRLANEELRREIEERRAAELAVEAERQRLYALLDGLPGLVYLKAPDFSLKFANRLFREICGDWEGKKCYEAIFKSEQPCENCTQFRVLETGQPSVKEATYAESNRTYQVYSYPFADVDGASLVLTLGIDITERQEATEALRRHRAEQQIILDSVPAMIFYKDIHNRFVRVNRAMAEITGLSIEEMEGKTAFEVLPDYAADYFRDDQEVIASGSPKRNIIEPLKTAAGLRWVQTDKLPYRDEQGNIIGIIGFSLDITERRTTEMRLRDSEERFRAIFESAAMGIALTDLEGRFLGANQTLQQMLGFTLDELRDKSYLALTHQDDLEENRKLFAELKFGQRDNYQMEKRYLRKDGRYLWTRATASLLKDHAGQPVCAVGIIEDITQAKQAEEQLQESEKRLRVLASQLITAQEDERKRISRELHDELGQALLVLKLQTRAIEEELQPEQPQLREQCLEMLSHLDQVVDNVRRLSRDLSPTILEDLGLSAALRHLIREFGKHYQIKYSAQETNIDDLFPLATQIAIYRIIQESLTNIGKHSQADLLLIAINKADDRVTFLIQDNGKGFDPAEKRRQSSGMGLAAMEERARMVGGTLSIWSQAGAGTKITLYIPYAANQK